MTQNVLIYAMAFGPTKTKIGYFGSKSTFFNVIPHFILVKWNEQGKLEFSTIKKNNQFISSFFNLML